MHEHNIKNLIFSSTAAVYGEPQIIPTPESHPKNPISPYAKTKLQFEKIIAEHTTNYDLNYVIFRYFNAAGANLAINHRKQPINETHLIPLALKALFNNVPLTIFGDNYPTPDGTCIRDYIHINDLARAHITALKNLKNNPINDCLNLGSTIGYSVKHVIDQIEQQTQKVLATQIMQRRSGDCAQLIADTNKITQLWQWKPKYSSLENIIYDAVQSKLR